MIKIVFHIFTLCVLVSCTKTKMIKQGDEAIISFILKNKAGMRIDNSFMPNGKMPLRTIIGKGYLIKDFDELLIGMKEGEKKTSKILPENAYGAKGIFYLNELGNKVFIIEPNDTLVLSIEVNKIISKENP